MTISLCMIVKNEQDTLARCLDSVKDAVDEIIIVDTGSEDHTKEIALQYTDKVFDFVWIDDFSAARNFSFSQATMDYQLWLDADDVLDADNRERLIALKTSLPEEIDIVTMRYHTHFDENGHPTLTSTRGRLFKRVKHVRWHDPIHEYVPLTGNIYHADNLFISHRKEHTGQSDRNIRIYENQLKQNKKLSPRGLYYYARELNDHGRYNEAVKFFDDFLATEEGWSEDNIAACFNMGICYVQLNRWDKALDSWLRSFRYDTPRAENCCQIGYYFKRLNDYRQAIFWFELAASLSRPSSMGFVLNDYWGYIPNLELVVCHDAMGNREMAVMRNRMAKFFKPESGAVAYNEAYFEKADSIGDCQAQN